MSSPNKKNERGWRTFARQLFFFFYFWGRSLPASLYNKIHVKETWWTTIQSFPGVFLNHLDAGSHFSVSLFPSTVPVFLCSEKTIARGFTPSPWAFVLPDRRAEAPSGYESFCCWRENHLQSLQMCSKMSVWASLVLPCGHLMAGEKVSFKPTLGKHRASEYVFRGLWLCAFGCEWGDSA